MPKGKRKNGSYPGNEPVITGPTSEEKAKAIKSEPVRSIGTPIDGDGKPKEESFTRKLHKKLRDPRAVKLIKDKKKG